MNLQEHMNIIGQDQDQLAFYAQVGASVIQRALKGLTIPAEDAYRISQHIGSHFRHPHNAKEPYIIDGLRSESRSGLTLDVYMDILGYNYPSILAGHTNIDVHVAEQALQGQPITEEDAAKIRRHISQHFGPVHRNTLELPEYDIAGLKIAKKKDTYHENINRNQSKCEMKKYNVVYVYTLGYATAGASERLQEWMSEQNTLLIDTRISPKTKFKGWHKDDLSQEWKERYRWAGEYLGNPNTFNGGPLAIVNPVRGINGLLYYLSRGRNLVLLCECKTYSECHRSHIIAKLKVALAKVELDVEIVPETEVEPGSL